MKIFRLKKSKNNLENLELFKEWGNFLMEKKAEIIETLIEENLREERISLIDSGQDLYLVCENEVEPGEKILPSNKERTLNKVHKKIWDLLEKEVVTEIPAREHETVLYEFRVE